MARTWKQDPYRLYNKEDKPARKQSNRRARHQTKLMMHDEQYDTLPHEPRTEGYETW